MMAATLSRITLNASRNIRYHAARLAIPCVNLHTVQTSYNGDIATLHLNRAPVNSFSLQFMEDICLALEDIERTCQGLVLTSDIPNVFCAGLDLNEVLQSSKPQLVVFRRRFQEMWSRLYGSRLVTIAAMKGHAIAGGCVLSLACDVSIIASGYTIGLPELALGLYLAPWMSGTLINKVGRNTAEKIIYTAQVLPAEKAAEIGLVDKVMPLDDVMSEAQREMSKILMLPREGRSLTKIRLHQDLLQLLDNTREEDIDMFIAMVTSEATRKQIAMHLDKLKTRKR